MAFYSIEEQILRFSEQVTDFLRLYCSDRDEFEKIITPLGNWETGPAKSKESAATQVRFSAIAFRRAIEKRFNVEGINQLFINWVLENCAHHGLIARCPEGALGSYVPLETVLEMAMCSGELEGYMFGYRYFLNARRESIIEIVVHEEDSTYSTGTGFALRMQNGNACGFTCKHVLYDKHDRPRQIHKISNLSQKIELIHLRRFTRIDACIFHLEDCFLKNALPARDGHLLDRVITAGFPRVFFDGSNPLLYHTGEINGWVGDIESGTRFGVTSAKVAPGNSGGPVLLEMGAVCGMVSDSYELEISNGAEVELGEYESQSKERNFQRHQFPMFIPLDQIRREIELGKYEDVDF